MTVAWAPTLEQVAIWVPWLTTSTATPGNQTYAGTFTTTTSPTDAQAQAHIDRSVAVIGAGISATLPTTLYPLASAVTALKTAIALARSFPRSAADLVFADALEKQYNTDYQALIVSIDQTGTSPVEAYPVWTAPDPVWWGDRTDI